MNQPEDYTVAEMTEIPHCDFCQHYEAVVDAATNHRGAWAYMCDGCWSVHGNHGVVGLGKGQMLKLVNS